MIIEHLGKTPRVHDSAYVAPNATICGDVVVGKDARILFGAVVAAEGGNIEIGERCIILENGVIRSTEKYSTRLGSSCLIGPGAHVVGCNISDCTFIATGAAVFHGAQLGARCEVRINGVVHVRSRLPADSTVPIGWIAVGDPAQILPPHEHEKIWSLQEPLNFPKSVYGVERSRTGRSIMPEVTQRLAEIYGAHREDCLKG